MNYKRHFNNSARRKEEKSQKANQKELRRLYIRDKKVFVGKSNKTRAGLKFSWKNFGDRDFKNTLRQYSILSG